LRITNLTIEDTKSPVILSNTSFGSMFFDSNLNSNITSWNTINVIDMSNMFSGATDFNQNIGGWDTSNVTSMNGMFSGATVFNNGQASGESTQKMNWTIFFTGTPSNFSNGSPLALASSNKPTFR